MRVLYNICLFTFLTVQLSAQQGLEKIIVEKYYVSDESDKAVDGDGGELPVNSVTYRVYVDMLPGYIFQAVYGLPGHELIISTSTRFFNNEDRGGMFPTHTRAQAENNTVMLDSWLSVGGAVRDHYGLLKSRDNGVDNIVNADGVLQNTAPQAGIPLTTQDGVVPGTPEPVTLVGFFDTDLSVLDDANDGPMPTIIRTENGAWSSLNPAVGPDPEENIVLIGQFTTDGVFQFELNLQIRDDSTLIVENYVAKNPVDNEILFESLIHIDSLDFESAIKDVTLNEDKVTIFPNPTSGNLTITLDRDLVLQGENDRYTLRGMDGAILAGGKVTGYNTQVDILHLTPGVYVLFLELGNTYIYTDKVVVTR